MTNAKSFSSYLLLIALISLALPTYAQPDKQGTDELGSLNPPSFSPRNYKEKMERFPDRVGIICFDAYMLDKSGAHLEALEFLKTCAEHGNVASMIYIASLYENGSIPVDYKKSAYWLKRGADTEDEGGYSALASYHYGVALSKGCGVEKDMKKAQFYFEKAARNGNSDAADFLREYTSFSNELGAVPVSHTPN